MITKQHIDDHQFVERYLADQLSDAEREEFETYYTQHPEILDDLQAAAGIKMGMALLRTTGELKPLPAPRSTPRWRPALALAASILIAAFAVAYLFRDTAPAVLANSLTSFDTPLTLAATYQVQRTRSDVDATVALPTSPQAIRLRVRPTLEPRPARYRIELLAVGGDDALTSIATLGGMPLDGDGFITLYVSSASLQPGSYELKVSDAAAAASVNDFLIEVVPATQI